MKMIDDLAAAVYDSLKFIVTSIGYLFAGGIIVAIPMYLIAWLFGMAQ